MWLTLAVVIVFSLFDGSFAQAPGDADPFCTEVLPGIGRNILDYAPQVKPLMDSRHYQNLLPPHEDAVWQDVDNDNNNRVGTTTDVSWVQILSKTTEGCMHLSWYSGLHCMSEWVR